MVEILEMINVAKIPLKILLSGTNQQSKARVMLEKFRKIFASHMFDPSFSQAYAEIYFG